MSVKEKIMKNRTVFKANGSPFIKVVVGLLLCTSTLSVKAGDQNLTCWGTIEAFHLGSWTGLYVKTSFNPAYMRICDLDGSYGQSNWGTIVPGDVCGKWLGVVTSSFQAQSLTRFWYENLETSDTCESLPDNSNAPSPSAVGLALEIES